MLTKDHSVMQKDQDFFHDCSGYAYTAIGSPVCSSDGFFVGICHDELGALLAVNIKTITTILIILHPEFIDMVCYS